jgi:hypothetical protein
MKEFVTYTKYNSLLDAAPLIEILSEAGIEYEIENASPSLDITFSANTMQNEYRVKIVQEDFEKADALLQDAALTTLDDIEEDHYLFDFTDEELLEILEKPDEWSNNDYIYARKIFQERGKVFSDEQLNTMRNKRIENLKMPLPEPVGLIRTGWFFAVAGGLFGLIIGWYLKEFKKTLFNGERVWVFDESTRNKGRQIMQMGLIIHIILIVVYLLHLFQSAL